MLQNFVSVQDYECSSSNNEDVSNNVEDATGSDTPIGVMPYNNEDSASNNEVASNHEEIVTVRAYSCLEFHFLTVIKFSILVFILISQF